MNRRQFLKRTMIYGALAVPFTYPFVEASWIRVTRENIAVPRMPAPFVGLKVAFLTDLHHGPYTGLRDFL